MILAELYTHLMASPAVTDLIGDRLYPLEAPQNETRSFAVYRQIDNDDDIIDFDTEQYTDRINIDAVAEGEMSYTASKDLMAAIKAAVKTWSGVIGERCVVGVVVENETDLKEGRRVVVTADFVISYL